MNTLSRHVVSCLTDSKSVSVRLHCDERSQPVLLRLSTLALTLFLILTWGSVAQAGGFNVDSLVTFTPLPSIYRTVTNTTGYSAGFAGKFIFTAQLTNKPDSPAMPGLDVFVQRLTNGNLLQNADYGPRGVGAALTVAKSGDFADHVLGPRDVVDVAFSICLKDTEPFNFFVDVLGNKADLSDSVVSR